ncbi:metallophosphoesterase [Archangium sp.]|uniref:metallophosphoesterase n=1 Tax=Archangium sp. TaxID=1872627 RepID=UPI00286A43B8|nr:metallophosphoesterase [Archangium sp.]
MRTVILSDLHLGNGGPYDIFAGGEELPALLDTLVSSPTRVVLNGDTFDFLLNEDPLALDVSQAVRQAGDLVAHPPTSEVMAALGRVLQAGGEVCITVGNHDLELALPQVQTVLRNALQQPHVISQRLSFPVGNEPLRFQVGGVGILVVHGEQVDNFNRVDQDALLARTVDPSTLFHYPPGSLLVKSLLNPLKVREGMRYMDLLKPDIEGAILTALGANPAALKVLLTPDTLRFFWRAFKNRRLRSAYSGGEEPSEWEGLGLRISDAGLTKPEAEAFARMLNASGSASFDGDDLLDQARLKLVREGLKLYAKARREWVGQYAKVHREWVGQKGVAYFELAPEAEELAEAQRLVRKYGGRAVVVGHTHSARWKQESGYVFANTGTWIWLLRMPAPDASDDEWRDFILELQDNPSLAPDKQRLALLERHFTCVEVEPRTSGGATMRLAEWKQGELHTLSEATLSP